MCQDRVRSLQEAPSTLCITRKTVGVRVCVFAIACSPHTPLRPPDVHSPIISLAGGNATCVKIAFDHCPRLHPPCVSRGTLCVCVCLFVCVCHCLCVCVCVSLPLPPSTLCITGGHCVCVCLPLPAYPHHTASSQCS